MLKTVRGGGTVHLWDDQNGYTTLPFSQFNYAYKPDNNGSVVSMTGVRVSKTKYYKFDDPTMFESDIPRETRVLTDLYLQDDTPSTGHKVVFFDIEVSMENGIPNIENPNNEVTAITLYDSVTKEYTVLVLDKTVSRGNYKKGDTDHTSSKMRLISSINSWMCMNRLALRLSRGGIVITLMFHICTIG